MEISALQWTKDYEVGIDLIDNQHFYFFHLINRIYEELSQSNRDSMVPHFLSELDAYAKFHFISEENLMRKYDYPHTETHRKHHLALLEELKSQEQLIINTKVSTDEMIHFLLNWFISHSVGEDKQVAEYILDKTKEA
jgi:hemerythrin